MHISESVQNLQDDPAALEALYRETRQSSDEETFKETVEDLYRSNPQSPLLAAWHHRLTFESVGESSGESLGESAGRAVPRSANWLLAGVLSLLTGLVFWALADEDLEFFQDYPAFLNLGAPIATLFILGLLSYGDSGKRRRALLFGGALALITLYTLLIGQLDFRFQQQYTYLIPIHLPLLSWAAVGLTLTAFAADSRSVSLTRFAFIRKSLEVFVTGGLYLVAGVVFGAITFGMFAALDIRIPETLILRIAVGGAGLLPIIAVASVYDINRTPDQQMFGQGVGRLVPILTQLLLPLSLVVMLVYIAVIPFNFYSPFRDRDVLIVYNIMLFAVMGLLVGVTPIKTTDIIPVLRPWVRRGVVALAALTVLVSLYALAAVITRTVSGGWTVNRITVIGWNAVNIGLLTGIAYTQLRLKDADWTDALKKVFGKGAMVYIAWALGLLLLLPLVLALT